MTVIRKVSSRLKKAEETPQKVEVIKTEIRQTGKFDLKTKKQCQFCKAKLLPYYWDISSLRKYLNDRGRIVPKSRSGVCAKHQRNLSREIKRARHLALLPFTVRI